MQILLAWSFVACNTNFWIVLSAVPFIGTRYYALFIIGHDGLHRRLCHSVWLNDLWNDLLILGPIGSITRLNRHNHMEHHRRVATLSDPDRYKYLRSNREGFLSFALSLTGLLFVWRALANVFGTRSPWHSQQREGYQLRDLMILVGWQVVLFAGLNSAIGWWAYFVLWWVPVYIFAFAADICRVFSEHGTLGSEEQADYSMRLISFRSNWFERQFFAPMGMNHHAVHHLWPSIPYYRLRDAESLITARPLAKRIEWRDSYAAFLFLSWSMTLRGSLAVEYQARP
jgi:fatty acid desaturase